MLTIKHVEVNGRERVFSTLSVVRTPEGQLVLSTEEVIKTGKIYVMNDAGQTVAVYDFNKTKQ